MVQWVRESSDEILNGLAYVPDDLKLEVFCVAAGLVLWRFSKELVTIRPVKSPGHY